MRLNRQDAERFAATLAPDGRLTAQAFDDTGADSQLAGQLSAPFSEVWRWLVDKQRQRCGAFLTINACNGRRLASNVTNVRALFADFDGPDPSAWHLPPSIIVQSRNGLHAYWLTADCPLVDFRAHQRRIAHHYGSDPKIIDLPRVMRLPGTAHLKGDAFLVRLLDCPGHGYTTDEIVGGLRLLPPPATPPPMPAMPANNGAGTGKRGDYRTLDLAKLFNDLGLYLTTIDANKHAVICPWQAGHTGNRQGPLDTILWQEPGKWPTFHCAHSHCSGKGTRDLLAKFDGETLNAYCSQPWAP